MCWYCFIARCHLCPTLLALTHGRLLTETVWFFLKSNVLFMLTIISRGDWLWCCSLSWWPSTIFCFFFLVQNLLLNKSVGVDWNVIKRSDVARSRLPTLEITCENNEQRKLYQLHLLLFITKKCVIICVKWRPIVRRYIH